MHTANLENCKTLYELSGWMGAFSGCTSSSCMHHAFYDNGIFICPKYPLGYLIRKLPYTTLVKTSFEGYDARWVGENDSKQFHADTPEDALCLLAIELFKKGILTKQGKE